MSSAATRHRSRRRVLLAVLLGASIATLGTASMSLALFTDKDTMDSSWTSGTIKLGLDTTTAFTATNILPGDGGSKTVVVSNTGTGQLRYALSSLSTSTDTKGLADQMTLSVASGACGATSGTLYTGALSGAKFGSNAAGPQTGDRTLDALSSESLCFTWAFPKDSGNAFQGANVTTTFTFDSEQTANNP